MDTSINQDLPFLNIPVSTKEVALPHWFKPAAYVAKINSDTDYAAGYAHLTDVGAAYETTYLYFTALNAALLPSVSMVINSSTGKDSTLMTSLYIAAMKQWKAMNQPLRPVLIQVSDTNSEFPEMALRMRAEVAALNKYAKTENLPIKAILVSPPPKQRLLVEIIGNGKPLPKLNSGKSNNGYEAASWCMDRVKKNVLDNALKLAKQEFSTFVQCLGVRHAESAKRSATIKRYALDDLPAISKLGKDVFRLGFCPIAHWDDVCLRNWLTEAQRYPEAECPWRPEGVEELINIYTKGTNKEENPHECALIITKDGSVSNSCSDLTGTRMGCWCCLLSTNRSLTNTANNDPRYVWLKKCHELIYENHEHNKTRVIQRNAAGFTVETLFPKSFTFELRYNLLVHIFRAELESGFELLQPEDLDAISIFWEKHGVFTVSVEEAMADAKRWKETGSLEFSYQKNMEFADILAKQLGEGIPAGAFFPGTDQVEPLNLAHLVGISAGGFGSPIVPTLLSYVFRDRRETDRIVVMVTDLPSVMGTRTNTGLLNGILGAAWRCINIRKPTHWEQTLSNGRIFFYTSSDSQERALIQKELTANKTDALDRYYENTQAIQSGCPEDPLAESIMLSQSIPYLPKEDLERCLALSTLLAYSSDELSLCIMQKSKRAVSTASQSPEQLESPEGSAYRLDFKKKLTKDLNLEKHLEVFNVYSTTLHKLLKLIRAGKASCALVQKCCYVARFYAVDPEEADQEWQEFIGIHAMPAMQNAA